MNDRPTREGPHTEIHSSTGTVEVVLPEAPGTGYVWKLAAAPASVHEVGRAFEDAGTTTGPTAGASGLRVFRLEAAERGRHELEFLLRRPWEETALERRLVTLVIDDGSD